MKNKEALENLWIFCELYCKIICQRQIDYIRFLIFSAEINFIGSHVVYLIQRLKSSDLLILGAISIYAFSTQILTKLTLHSSFKILWSLFLTLFFFLGFWFLDIVLYLCEKEHVEGGMIFQLLEDLTEMSTMKNCKDIFGYIESKQDILGKVCVILLFLVIFILVWQLLHPYSTL